LLQVGVVLAFGLAVTASALAIWSLTSSNGLLDIGDPFHVAATHAFGTPRTENHLCTSGGRTRNVAPFPSRQTESLRPRRPPDPRAIRRSGPGSGLIALSRDGLVTLAPSIRLLVEEEGLTAHRPSVDHHRDGTPGAR
jgi:hypothetical protein